MKRIISEPVFQTYDIDRVPHSSLDEFIAWLTEKRELIPKEFQSTAQILIDTEYESSSVELAITYQREETDAEVNARNAQTQEYEEQRKHHELQILAQLKAKYER